MSQRAKLIERMRDTPGNIRFAQVNALLRHEGFVLFNKREAIALIITQMADSLRLWFRTESGKRAIRTMFANFWRCLGYERNPS